MWRLALNSGTCFKNKRLHYIRQHRTTLSRSLFTNNHVGVRLYLLHFCVGDASPSRRRQGFVHPATMLPACTPLTAGRARAWSPPLVPSPGSAPLPGSGLCRGLACAVVFRGVDSGASQSAVPMLRPLVSIDLPRRALLFADPIDLIQRVPSSRWRRKVARGQMSMPSCTRSVRPV